MAHPYLITGGNQEARLEKAKEIVEKARGIKFKNFFENPDVFVLEEQDSIKIEQVRDFKKKLQLRPYSEKFKTVVLHGAEKLTMAAQNALLKTLEEPPGKSVIILTADSAEAFLATILSRVRIIRLKTKGKREFSDEKIKKEVQATGEILSMPIGERLKRAELIGKTKETTLEFLADQVYLWRWVLREKVVSKEQPSPFDKLDLARITKTIKDIQKTFQLVKNQVNHRLAIENLLMSYPRI